MSLTIEDIRAAAERIRPYAVRTPLLRLPNLDEYLGCEVYAKAECMQITGAFKLRGAMNRALMLSQNELKNGIVAASSGNHGRAVAYAAKLLGARATIVMPHTVPAVKVEAIKALGAEVVQCEASERFHIARQICDERQATMIPPFDDEAVMAGQGTLGLEITEQCPELDALIVPVSGGGLISGVATAIKTLSPRMKVYGAEPAVLPRYSASIAAGKPTQVPYNRSIADALAAQIPGEKCFPYVAANTDAIAAVEEKFILRGMKLLLTQGKILAEPSSCIGIGAVLQGLIPVGKTDKVCFLISGGNVGLEQLGALDTVEI